MDIRVVFGNNVRRFRLGKGISQESLAHQAEIDRTYLPSIEKGQRNVSLVVANRIANALDIDLCELIKTNGEKHIRR